MVMKCVVMAMMAALLASANGSDVFSDGINIASDTDYEFSAMLLADASDPDRMMLSSCDVLVDPDAECSQTDNLFFAVDDVIVSELSENPENPGNPPETFTQSVTHQGQTITLQMVKDSVRGPHFEVLVQNAQGSYEAWQPGAVRTYIGTVDERPDAYAAGILLDDGTFKARVFFDRGATWYTSGSSVIGTRGTASTTYNIPSLPSVTPGKAGTNTYSFGVGFDSDYRYYAHRGSVAGCLAMMEFTAISLRAQYVQNVMLMPELGRVVIRPHQLQCPYEGVGGNLLGEFRNYWNANHPVSDAPRDVAALVSPTIGGGVAWVGVIGTGNAYSSNGIDSDGSFDVVWRHELGHNWGTLDYHANSPEGPTMMCGNQYARFNGPAVETIFNHRDSRIDRLTNKGTYSKVNLPPYAAMDFVDKIYAGQSVTIDVMANDFDVNGQALSLHSFESASDRGGTITLSAGTGPDGRDELIYTAPMGVYDAKDYFHYTIEDSAGARSTGVVIVYIDLDSPLRLYFPLDETSGTVAGNAGVFSNHGTLRNVSFDNASAEGVFGNGLLLNGVDQRIEVPGLNTNSHYWTLSAWVKPTSTPNGWAGIIFSRSGGATGLNFGTNGELRYHWNTAGDWQWNTGLTPPVGQWTFVALVITPNQARFYMGDGAAMQVATRHASHGDASFAGTTMIGHDSNHGTRYFGGIIDEVRIYDKALSQQELSDIMRGVVAGSPLPPDGQEGITNRTLRWVPAPAAIGYDVYVGTSASAVAVADPESPEYLGFTTASQQKFRFLPFTTFYWRVDTVLQDDTVVGPVWSFTTGDVRGGILREAWLNIPGNLVRALTDNPRFPDNPDVVELVSAFEGPRDWDNAYGTRLHGFVIPPQTGQYTFWIASDDNSELWLSASTNPAHAVRIAHVTGDPAWTDYRQWDKYASQKSNSFTLYAGRPYYIRALHKEGAGGDHISVAWMGPNVSRQVIDGRYLIPYDPDIDWSPYFKEDPIEIDVLEGYDYSLDISDLAVGFDGYALTFMKIDGPDWLALSSEGVLSGVARDADTGLDVMTIQARDAFFRTGQTSVKVKVWDTFTGEKGLEDLAGLAEFWLQSDCTDFPPCGGADLTGNKSVDHEDLAVMSSTWLHEN